MTTLKKILKKLKRDDVIEVKWLDHFTAAGWGNVEMDKPVYCFSVGYYHGHDKLYIHLMSSITPGNSGGVMCRIKSDIVNIRKLKP